MAGETVDLSFCLKSAREWSEKALWVENSLVWQGASFVQRVELWVRAFAARRLQPEDVVAISLPPSVDLFASTLAVWQLGGAVLLLPGDLSLDESLRWMQSAESVGGVIANSALVKALDKQGFPSWRWGIAGHNVTSEEWTVLEEVLEGVESQPNPSLPTWSPERRAVLSMSAGSWQPPLVVSLTQSQMWAAIDSLWQGWKRVGSGVDAGLLELPVSSALLQVGLGMMLGGATVHLLANASLSELSEVANAYKKPVALSSSRNICQWSLSLSEELPLSLEWLWALGSSVTEEVADAWPIPIYGAYKIEACGGIVAWANQKGQGVGRLLPGLEVKVERDPLMPQRHRKPGDPLRGEILLRGPQVSLERMDTESRFFEVETAVPGWFSTRDWGALHRDKLIIDGHVEDMVEYRSGYFSMRPVERKLTQHPQILDAVLCKVEQGKKLKAFVEVDTQAPGRPLSTRRILTYLQEHFPHYMHPKYVEFREVLPRNLYGQVARWKLK